MRQSLRGTLLGLAGLALANCAGGNGTESRYAHTDKAELLAMLQLGRPVLDCRETCLDAWKRVQPQAMSLDASAQWNDLAVLVMRTGYQDDLSLYYLGRAAEGTGFYAAAVSYYRQSTELSGTAIACARLSQLCGGVTLPAAAAARLAAAQRMLAPNRARPHRPATNAPAPGAEPAPTTEPAAIILPPAPDVPVPAQPAPAPAAAPPAPPAPAPTPGASDYIEPPPASR
jgi:hypothetical protein